MFLDFRKSGAQKPAAYSVCSILRLCFKFVSLFDGGLPGLRNDSASLISGSLRAMQLISSAQVIRARAEMIYSSTSCFRSSSERFPCST